MIAGQAECGTPKNLLLRETHAGWGEIRPGKTKEEIGDILGCSCHMCRNIWSGSISRLGVENRTAAATLATEAARTYRKSNGSGA
jgi:hypothetical protein